MQGRILARAKTRDPKRRIGSRVVGGMIAVIAAVAAVSIYTFWRVDRVQENVVLLNQFYVPVLKHLNLFNGKWSAYQRSFEQSVGFRKWGSRKYPVSASKLHLRKMIEANLDEFNAILAKQSGISVVHERVELANWVAQVESVAAKEQAVLIEISSLVRAKHFSEAASLYGKARQEHLTLTQGLVAISRAIENRIATLQLSTEQELRSSQGVLLLLLATSLLFSVFILFRLRRWLRPVQEWTRVAQEIALKGMHSLGKEIRFPQLNRGMPPEIALLTREFTRMGMTVLERERTIQTQKEKLESLNQHLKDQNEMLRRLGSLNERVLNGMSAGLLVINADGRVEQFNERYCRIFNVDRRKLLAADARELLSAWPSELVEQWLRAMEPVQLNHVRLDRRVYDVRVQQLPAQAGRLVLFEDVTELYEAEQKLEHARKLVLAGNLSSQVAHEVRNPLNSMSLQLEMLEEDLSDIQDANCRDRAIARAAAVSEQVQRLERITRRYLDVRRVDGDRSHLESVDVHALVEKCVAFLSGEIQAAEVRVNLELGAREPIVKGDADALSQVLFNLIRNSLDALKEVSGVRTLCVKSADDALGLRITLMDNGPGVPEYFRERIFEPFVTRKADGHGLGLSVSRQICIEHGGELKYVSSNTGPGASFEFVLPVTKDAPKSKARDSSVTHIDR